MYRLDWVHYALGAKKTTTAPPVRTGVPWVDGQTKNDYDYIVAQYIAFVKPFMQLNIRKASALYSTIII